MYFVVGFKQLDPYLITITWHSKLLYIKYCFLKWIPSFISLHNLNIYALLIHVYQRILKLLKQLFSLFLSDNLFVKVVSMCLLLVVTQTPLCLYLFICTEKIIMCYFSPLSCIAFTYTSYLKYIIMFKCLTLLNTICVPVYSYCNIN